MEEFTTFAHTLADASGEILRKYFRAPDLSTENKVDASPVTLADREAEATLRNIIEQTYPQHGFVGEESGKAREEAEYLWVIDPIDGTRNFIAGKPVFGTLIALIHKRKPILGMIDCPITNERWHSSEPALSFLNNHRISVNKNNKSLNECIFSTTAPYLFTGEKKTGFERLREKVGQTTFGCDCYAYGLLAAGHLDLVVESGLKAHDVMALIPVIEGAGGMITNWQGHPVPFTDGEVDVIAAATPALHAEAQALLC